MLFNFKNIVPASMKAVSKYPFMNESFQIQDYMSTRPLKTYDDLDFWIERTPEAIAIISAVVTDLSGDGIRFEPIKKVEGKQKENSANKDVELAQYFAKTNFFLDELNRWNWDWVKYGDAYQWIGGVKLWLKVNKIKEKISLDIDEDFPKAIRTVSANTMDILHDGKVITSFKQNVLEQARDPISWDVKDIIHEMYMPNKGKVYGFSPSQAALSELSILGYLKDYVGTFFKNGGVPDWMFVMKNEMAGSPNHKRLIEMLKKYKNPVTKHGNLVFAGEVEPKQLGTGLEEIRVNDLVILFTSVYALAHNMPVSRVAALIGADVKVSSGGDDLANEGYWAGIGEKQNRIESVFNTQLWEPYFNVRMRINRAWKTNEIKEQQRNQFAIGNVAAINTQLMRYDKQVNLGWIKRQMYLNEEDLEKVSEETKLMQQQQMMGGMGGFGGKQPDNLEVKRGAATQSMRDQKKKQVTTEQKLTSKKSEMKGRMIRNVSKELFFDKFNKLVKPSATRELYFFTTNGVMNVSFSTPEEDFNLVIAMSELSKTELSEIRGFGHETR